MTRYQVEIDAPLIIEVNAEDKETAERVGNTIYARAYLHMDAAVQAFAATIPGGRVHLGERYDDTEVIERTWD